MSLKVGTSNVGSIKVGTSVVSKIYVGTSLAWSNWKDVYLFNSAVISPYTWTANEYNRANSYTYYNAATTGTYLAVQTGSGGSGYSTSVNISSTALTIPKNAVYLNVEAYSSNTPYFCFGLATSASQTVSYGTNGKITQSGGKFSNALSMTTSYVRYKIDISSLSNTTKFKVLMSAYGPNDTAHQVRIRKVWFSRT